MYTDRGIDLDREFSVVTALISQARPGQRHEHLPRLHALVTGYARREGSVPQHLRQLQEDLTNEAMEARFDNLPI